MSDLVPTELDTSFSIDEHDVAQMIDQLVQVHAEPTSTPALRRFAREQVARALRAFLEQHDGPHITE